MNDHYISTVYADSNNFDQSRFSRLNTAGSRADLERMPLNPGTGLKLRLTDGELAVEGMVCGPGAEGVWRAQVDKSAIVDLRPDQKF